jgi:hypothetical protein
MNKTQLEREVWKHKVITILFVIAFITLLVLAYFISNKQTASYKQGFQDGQANCSNEYNGLLKLSSFEIEYNETGIPEFVIWYSFNSDYEYRGLICPEGYIINITSPREIGCVRK